MQPITTDAIVLHTLNYLETSRILRLLTRDAGVVSVLARGARNSRKRFGSALDLFAEGSAQLQLKPGRDLHTLTSFDITRARSGLSESLARFSAGAAVVECVLRVVHDEAAPGVYETVAGGLDAIAAAEPLQATSAGLGALWQLVSHVGFAPSIEVCANCHTPLSLDGDAVFSHAAGGALCARCAGFSPGGRKLPASALLAIGSWINGQVVTLAGEAEGRAHQRLFREFLTEHLPDNRRSPAYAAWESGQLTP
jgi:DNA repair protein RecO (recombination protein O)